MRTMSTGIVAECCDRPVIKHRWSSVVRYCLDCDLIASPEAVAVAEHEEQIKLEERNRILALIGQIGTPAKVNDYNNWVEGLKALILEEK